MEKRKDPWVVKYPPGTGMLDGKEVSNEVIADKILIALEASKGFKVEEMIQHAS